MTDDAWSVKGTAPVNVENATAKENVSENVTVIVINEVAVTVIMVDPVTTRISVGMKRNASLGMLLRMKSKFSLVPASNYNELDFSFFNLYYSSSGSRPWKYRKTKKARKRSFSASWRISTSGATM